MSKKMIPLLVIILSIFIITPVIAENLVSFYRFDESTGTIACDSTGNGHTGTVSGIGDQRQSFLPLTTIKITR
mgnify:CR=1 FL=1